MRLVRWDPFRDLMNVHRQASEAKGSYGTWAPLVDVFETGEDLVIRAEIAGIEKDDVDITVDNSTLMLRGERKRESGFDEKVAYHLERSFGTFTRSFTLPETVDSTRISASCKDGVLELRIPKIEKAKPRKVEIEAA